MSRNNNRYDPYPKAPGIPAFTNSNQAAEFLSSLISPNNNQHVPPSNFESLSSLYRHVPPPSNLSFPPEKGIFFVGILPESCAPVISAMLHALQNTTSQLGGQQGPQIMEISGNQHFQGFSQPPPSISSRSHSFEFCDTSKPPPPILAGYKPHLPKSPETKPICDFSQPPPMVSNPNPKPQSLDIKPLCRFSEPPPKFKLCDFSQPPPTVQPGSQISINPSTPEKDPLYDLSQLPPIVQEESEMITLKPKPICQLSSSETIPFDICERAEQEKDSTQQSWHFGPRSAVFFSPVSSPEPSVFGGFPENSPKSDPDEYQTVEVPTNLSFLKQIADLKSNQNTQFPQIAEAPGRGIHHIGKFKPVQVLMNRKLFTQKRKQCRVCWKIFRNWELYGDHTATCELISKPFNCELCPFISETQLELVGHLLTCKPYIQDKTQNVNGSPSYE